MHLTMNSDKDKTFMRWTVPSRLTESVIQEDDRGSLVVESVRAESPAKVTKRTTSGLPNINMGRLSSQACQRPESRVPVHSAPPATPSLPPQSPTAKPKYAKKTKQQIKNDLMKSYNNHDVPSTDEHWFKGGLEADKKLVDRATRSATKPPHNPNIRQPINDWLKSATERDRQVAMQFFQNLGGKVMNKEDEKYQEVLDTLNNGRGLGKLTMKSMDSESDEVTRLHHLRLLTPATRKNKSQYQTWHHLPPYRDDNPVANKSAIYTNPHAIVPRHFSIHPDWGL